MQHCLIALIKKERKCRYSGAFGAFMTDLPIAYLLFEEHNNSMCKKASQTLKALV